MTAPSYDLDIQLGPEGPAVVTFGVPAGAVSLHASGRVVVVLPPPIFLKRAAHAKVHPQPAAFLAKLLAGALQGVTVQLLVAREELVELPEQPAGEGT